MTDMDEAYAAGVRAENADRANRRSMIQNILAGLAVLTVLLAVLGTIMFAVDRTTEGNTEKEITERVRMEQCTTIEDRTLRALCISGFEVEPPDHTSGG